MDDASKATTKKISRSKKQLNRKRRAASPDSWAKRHSGKWSKKMVR